MTEDLKPQKTIWAVGGGKGGTGKSFLSASLAIESGARGRDTIAIDADLGGPNLHTLLAVRENGRDLGDFVMNRFPRLDDVVAPTSHRGLRIIKGSDHALFLANLNHYRKLKLIRQIKSLPAAGVIIDLGTGSAYNTLDLFIIAKPGILVVTPEPTAVENAYFFLKSCAVRILKLYAQHFKMPNLGQQLTEELESNAGTLQAFLTGLAARDSAAARIFMAALQNFRPGLIINKARTSKDFLLGRSMVDAVKKYFLIEIDLLGTLPYDERVHWSLQKFVPYILEYPESTVSRAIRSIADQLAARSSASEERMSDATAFRTHG
jgi:flagellar biosynthesis protein FlhG